MMRTPPQRETPRKMKHQPLELSEIDKILRYNRLRRLTRLSTGHNQVQKPVVISMRAPQTDVRRTQSPTLSLPSNSPSSPRPVPTLRHSDNAMTGHETLINTDSMRGGGEEQEKRGLSSSSSGHLVSGDKREFRGDCPWRHADWLLPGEYYEALGRDLEKTAYAFYRHESLQVLGRASDGRKYVEELWSMNRIICHVQCLDIATRRHGGVPLSHRVEIYRAKKLREYLQRHRMGKRPTYKSSKGKEKANGNNNNGTKQQQQQQQQQKTSSAARPPTPGPSKKHEIF